MRQKRLERYPVEYWTAVRLAHVNGRHVLTFDSRSVARRRREDLYHFRQALRDASLENPSDESLLVMTARADRLTFALRDNTVILHV